MKDRRRGGGRPMRREIRPGIGRPFEPRPEPVPFDLPGPDDAAHDHAHWHFWRFAQDLARIDYVKREVPADTWYARDEFPTTAAAVEGVAEDAVQRYPDAKRLKALADFRALAPAHPGSSFQYRTKKIFVIWGLLGCDGDCESGRNAHAERLHAAIQRMLDRLFAPGRDTAPPWRRTR